MLHYSEYDLTLLYVTLFRVRFDTPICYIIPSTIWHSYMLHYSEYDLTLLYVQYTNLEMLFLNMAAGTHLEN